MIVLQVDVTEFHVQYNIHFRQVQIFNLRSTHMLVGYKWKPHGLVGMNFCKCITCSDLNATGKLEGNANYLLKEEINS